MQTCAQCCGNHLNVVLARATCKAAYSRLNAHPTLYLQSLRDCVIYCVLYNADTPSHTHPCFISVSPLPVQRVCPNIARHAEQGELITSLRWLQVDRVGRFKVSKIKLLKSSPASSDTTDVLFTVAAKKNSEMLDGKKLPGEWKTGVKNLFGHKPRDVHIVKTHAVVRCRNAKEKVPLTKLVTAIKKMTDEPKNWLVLDGIVFKASYFGVIDQDKKTTTYVYVCVARVNTFVVYGTVRWHVNDQNPLVCCEWLSLTCYQSMFPSWFGCGCHTLAADP